MSVSSTQHFFVNTAHCEGSPFYFTASLPSQAITCNFSTQTLRIRLQNFSIYHSWYNISDQFNTLAITNTSTLQTTSRSVPPGNYTYTDLARAITGLFDDAVPGIQCRYLRSQNKLQLTFPSQHQLSFVDGSYKALGFVQGETPISTLVDGVHTITSSRVLRPMDSSEFVLQIVNLSPVSTNFNTSPGGTQTSNFLAAVSFDSRPFTTFNWKNDNDLFPMAVAQTDITSITFLVTDFDGNTLTFLPDFTFSLAIDVLDTPQQDPSVPLLNQMAGTLKDIFMFEMLGADRARIDLASVMQDMMDTD